MLDSEGFPIVEEGTVARLLPLAGKYTAYYATFYGRIVGYRSQKWHTKWHRLNTVFPPAAHKGRNSTKPYMQFSSGGVLSHKYVHRLVAMAWLPVGELWQNQIDHINGNRFNNRADNLRWCSNLENQRYASAIRRGETIITNLQKVKFYAD